MDLDIRIGFCRQDCITCGVVFFLPETLDKHVRDTGQSFYCPNGHAQSYTESRADKFKRLYEAETKRRENLDSRLAGLQVEHRKTAYDLEKLQEQIKAKKAKITRKKTK
jgi:hypothetical protein